MTEQVVAEIMTDEQVEELRAQARRPMTLPEIHSFMSYVLRRLHRGRISPPRARALRECVATLADIAYKIEDRALLLDLDRRMRLMQECTPLLDQDVQS